MGARNDWPSTQLAWVISPKPQKLSTPLKMLSSQTHTLHTGYSHAIIYHTYRQIIQTEKKKILRGQSRAVSHHSLSSWLKLLSFTHTHSSRRSRGRLINAPSEFRLFGSSTSSWAAWSPSASCWTRTDRCRGRPAVRPIWPCSDRWTCPNDRRRHWQAHSPVHSLIGWHIWPVAWSSFSVEKSSRKGAGCWYDLCCLLRNTA